MCVSENRTHLTGSEIQYLPAIFGVQEAACGPSDDFAGEFTEDELALGLSILDQAIGDAVTHG
jgi:hypothetical protein